MNKPTPFFLVAILGIIITATIALALVYFFTAIRVYDQQLNAATPEVTQVCNSRPCICEPHYNQPGDDWAECMGVGYVAAVR